MINKFFLKRYDFKVLAYKSLQVFILFLLTIIVSDSPEPEFLLLKYLALENVTSLSIPWYSADSEYTESCSLK